MNAKRFLEACVKNDMPYLDYSPISDRLTKNSALLRLLHAAIGMSGETGELMDQLKKCMMYGKPLNYETLIEECGVVLWYMAIMLDETGYSFEEVMQKNVDKLAKRYPAGFTEKDAIERKDKK